MSLRSVGCRASIVILTEIGHDFGDALLRVIDASGAGIEEHAWPSRGAEWTDFVRQTWLLSYLSARERLDRVLSVDAFDVLFQSDPFSAFASFSTGMAFFAECQAIARHYWNRRWVAGCFGAPLLARVQHETILCTGVIFGTRDAYVAFLRMVLPYFGEGCRADQGVLNGLVYGGNLTAAGVPFRIVPSGLVLHMTLCSWRVAPDRVVTAGDREVAIAHQFNRSPQGIAVAYGRCPAANVSIAVRKIGVR